MQQVLRQIPFEITESADQGNINPSDAERHLYLLSILNVYLMYK